LIFNNEALNSDVAVSILVDAAISLDGGALISEVAVLNLDIGDVLLNVADQSWIF
jgi:hypothetical protein